MSAALFHTDIGHGTADDGAESTDGAADPLGYKDVDCWFDLGPQQRDGREIICGQLTVPESWHADEFYPIHLPIVRFGARSGIAKGEPIIFLVGGPNQRAFLRDANSVQSFWIDNLRNHVWTDRHDVIVITPRGANWTDSNLECPELYDPRIALGAAGRQGGQVDWRTTFWPAYGSCIERLKRMHDLRGYSLDQMAYDVLMLKDRLELDAWSLMGVSFGTRLALEVMRAEPSGLEKVVLDSVMPPGEKPVRGEVAGIDRVINKIFAACADDTACRHDYPDLEELLPAASKILESNYHSWIENRRSFGKVYFNHDPASLWYALFHNLYDPASVSTIPSLLAQIASGNLAPIRDMHWNDIHPPHELANAAFELVTCNRVYDDLGEVDRQGLEAEFPLYKSLIADLWEYLTHCSDWPLLGQDEDEEVAVTSAIPTLLLAGEFDAVTPLEDAEKVAATLGKSHLFVFEDQAHSVLTSSPCAAAVTTAFLRDPSIRPDIDCSLLDRKIVFKPRIRREEVE